jgi:hypothetical protein
VGITSLFVDIESLPPCAKQAGLEMLLAVGFFVARYVVLRYFAK